MLRGSTSSLPTSRSTLVRSHSVSEQNYSSNNNSAGRKSTDSVARALQQGRWLKGNDGFLVSDICGVDDGGQSCTTPTVWLQQTEDAMYLCPYQYRSLTLILLVPVSSILNGEQSLSLVKQQVLENVSSFYLLVISEFVVLTLLHLLKWPMLLPLLKCT